MAKMAILQEVDKCIRCNGCVVGCKRTWQMKVTTSTYGVHRVLATKRLEIKSQKRVDMGPFVRYSCWHCENPPCARRCPFKAITKESDGSVNVSPTLCQPDQCARQCVRDCQRGGYPKVGSGTDDPTITGAKMFKCTLCHDKISVLPGNKPTCVYTCPAKAMTYGTRASVISTMRTGIANGTWRSYVGDGSVFWVSKKAVIVPPKADPFFEDHVAPMVSNILSGPFAKAALVPTLVAGGLLALSARRAELEDESHAVAVGEV
ncbi:MAG: 4Fe-4S dicluster domain-containing protein [Coriobacteriia bacterium]